MLGNDVSGRSDAVHAGPSDDRGGDSDLSMMLTALVIGIVVGIGAALQRGQAAPASVHAGNWLRPYGC